MNDDILTWANDYFDVIGSPKSLRIKQKVSGAAIMPIDENLNFLLIKILRKDGNYHWEFPRGFAKPNEDLHDTALRELKEETGIDGKQASISGYVMPDSGLIDSKIPIFTVGCSFEDIDEDLIHSGNEGIIDYKIVSYDELLDMLGEITDGFTLAAIVHHDWRNMRKDD